VDAQAFESRGELFGARPARTNVHPIRSLSAEAATPQLGIVGPWHERLPHFRIDHTPSVGA
jgi:alditol oxidase